MKSNDNYYVREAFSRLKCLDEEVFDLSVDAGKLDDLREFVADDIAAPAEEYIIDAEAKDEHDLQDTYVGKVILECTCCHSRIYKNEDEVLIDEETGMANINEECPVCDGLFGFNVIGKIEPFNDEADFGEKEEEPEEVEAEEEISDEEIGEALKEALAEEKDCCDGKDCDCDEACHKDLEEDGEPRKCKRCGREEDGNDVVLDNDGLCDVCHDDLYEECKDESLQNNELASEDSKKLDEEKDCDCEDKKDCDEEKCDEACNESKGNGGYDRGKDKEIEDSIPAFSDDDTRAKEESLEKVELASEDSRKLDEAIEEVEVKTEDGEVEVEKDGNKVTVEFKDEEVAEPADNGDEMIVPLDVEDKEAIENNELKDEFEEEPVENEEPIEEPVEGDEIEDFDEEGFEEMGESYLTRVYDNVKTFKVNEVKEGENKELVVEGLITFESGKEAKTSFVFENSKTTKRGKTLFEGHNDMFSKSNKAFMLKGLVENKKFVCESLTYSYNATNINESNESESVKVYGRVVR